MPKQIRIGLIGYRGIGKVHSHGYRSVLTFFNLDVVPVLKAICGRDAGSLKQAASGYGWESYSTNWHELIERNDIDLIDICTPPNLHSEIAIEAAKAGKNVICEKPLARSLPQAVQMIEAVYTHNVRHMTAFNYRCVPAVRLAKQLIEAGEIGDIYQWRAHWLSDLMDPGIPLRWFFQKDKAGSDALQDIGSHIIDLAHFLVRKIEEVSSVSKIFVFRRYIEGSLQENKEVDVEDAGQFIVSFSNGAIGTFEASRVAGGYRDEFTVEVCGSKGTLRFNSKILYELVFYTTRDEAKLRSPRKIFVGSKEHPYQESICPYGEVIGRNDLFIIQGYELLKALATGANPSPSFIDGGYCQAVLTAVLDSARDREWRRPAYDQIESAIKSAT